MQIPNYMRGEAHALSITLVGCGGTGTLLLQHLARINCAMIALGTKGLVVTCVDDDIVTPANLGRQLFTQNDIGRAKSVVMIERINRFYSTNWIAIPSKFDKQLTQLENFPGNIIITCVDNIKTRRFVSHYLGNVNLSRQLDHLNNWFWIDTGNGKDFGQVLLSSTRLNIPDIFTEFPKLKESRKKTPSCSLQEALLSQDLFINADIALTTAKLIWDLVRKDELTFIGSYINQRKQTPVRQIKTPCNQYGKEKLSTADIAG